MLRYVAVVIYLKQPHPSSSQAHGSWNNNHKTPKQKCQTSLSITKLNMNDNPWICHGYFIPLSGNRKWNYECEVPHRVASCLQTSLMPTRRTPLLRLSPLDQAFQHQM